MFIKTVSIRKITNNQSTISQLFLDVTKQTN